MNEAVLCHHILVLFFPPQLAHSQEQKEEDDKGELVEQLLTLQTHKSFIAEVSNHRHYLSPVFFRFLLGSDVLDEGDEVDEHQPFPSLSQVNSSSVCPDFLFFLIIYSHCVYIKNTSSAFSFCADFPGHS